MPYAHGRWVAEHIRGATADLNDADGHVTSPPNASVTSTNGWPATSSSGPEWRLPTARASAQVRQGAGFAP